MGRLEDFENKIARAQAGKQISRRVQAYINPQQHLSDMDFKKKFCMTVLPQFTFVWVRAWHGIWVETLKNVSQ